MHSCTALVRAFPSDGASHAAAMPSSYKIPKSLILIEALPRNAMGKVTKPVLKEML